jgi:hypothetical protein
MMEEWSGQVEAVKLERFLLNDIVNYQRYTASMVNGKSAEWCQHRKTLGTRKVNIPVAISQLHNAHEHSWDQTSDWSKDHFVVYNTYVNVDERAFLSFARRFTTRNRPKYQCTPSTTYLMQPTQAFPAWRIHGSTSYGMH